MSAIVGAMASSSFADAVTRGFSARVVASKDHHIQAKWKNTVSTEGARVASASRYCRGENVVVIVLLQGMATAHDGRCDVSFDLKITPPSGDDPAVLTDLLGRRDRLGAPGNVFLADSIVEIEYEESDPLGDYEIALVARDAIAGATFACSTGFSLIEYGADHRDLSTADALQRITTYYLQPDPHLLFEMMQAVVDERPGSARTGMPVAFGPFFRQLLRDNPYQRPHLRSYLAKLSADERMYLLPMLKGAIEDAPTLLDGIPNAAHARRQLADSAYPDIWDQDIADPHELDMLWSHFFATGDIAPIRKIATATALSGSPPTSHLHLVGQAAKWSLGSNCAQHALVRAYCDYLARDGSDLDQDTRTLLADVVREAKKEKQEEKPNPTD